MISGRCRRRERDLLALPRQILRLVIGVLTDHTQVGRHLSIMGLKQDPLCSYCSAAEESASHFLCQCDYFATLRMRIWGKPDLYPADIDTATVGDIARFIKKISQIPIEYPALTGTTGDGWWTRIVVQAYGAIDRPAPFWNYGTVNLRRRAAWRWALQQIFSLQGYWLFSFTNSGNVSKTTRNLIK